MKAEIQFEAGRWYLLTLSYSPQGTALYVNAQLAAEGSGLPVVDPALAGLVVGSDLSGGNLAGGLCDEVTTFGQPATPENQAAYFNAVSGQAALGSISAAEEEAALKAAEAWQAEQEAGMMRFASSEPADPCVTNGPVYLTNIVAVLDTNQSWTVSFTILGGTNGVSYDIFTTTNLLGSHITNSLWTWLDMGYTCYRYTFTNQPDTNAFYVLGTPWDSDGDGLTDAYEQLVSKTLISTNDTDGDAIPDGWEVAHGLNPLVNDAGEDPDDDGVTNLQEYQNNTDPFDNMLVVWGDNASGQGTVPWGFGPVAAMAGGGGRASGGHTLVVTNQGRVVAWGANDFRQAEVPANLSNVLAVVAGGDQSAALKADGTVVQWGRTNVAIPSGLNNVTALSAGYHHFLALRADGTVVAWGNTNSPADSVPSSLNGVTAISAGWNHNLALRTNGTVLAWGLGGQALGWNLTNAPDNLTNIAAIAAGALHSVVLRRNGTVVAWGYNAGDETNVPAGLSNVVAIAAGRGYSLALRSDGSVEGWGLGLPFAPPGLAGLTSIAAGPGHALATRRSVLTPLILRQPRSRGVAAGTPATFAVAVSSRSEPAYQWQFNSTNNIADATNATLSVTNVQASSQGLYRVRVSNGAGTNYSADAELVLVLPPVLHSPVTPQTVWVEPGNTYTLSVYATAQGSELEPLNYTWFKDGTVVSSALGTSNLMLGGITPLQAGQYWVTVANDAGSTNSATWSVGVLNPGGVVAWGNIPVLPPSGLTNVIALACGGAHGLAVDEKGVGSGWGTNDSGQTNVPGGLSNVVAVAAGTAHSLALKADGTVIGWGRNDFNQTNVPANVTSAIAISAGGNQSLALRPDGTVVQWGQTNAAIPATLTNAIAIASGTNFHLALRSNTTVIAWGSNDTGQTNVPTNLSNVVAIAAGGRHALALRENGTVVAWGNNSSLQTNVPANLTNAMAVAAGDTFSAALRNDGTVVCWGDNSSGQTNVPPQLVGVKLLAAGGDQVLASVFSPLTQYSVEVTKDLLLIYNTNSLDSSNVCAYYLAHRPMVGGANVLGINCLTNEQTSGNDFTNQILPQVRSWLTANPTKPPQYVILFPAIPSRVWTGDSNAFLAPVCSVGYGLATTFSGIQPFVMSINMGHTNLTNDCIAYINKLHDFGTTNSPSKLFISAGTGGYGNTNYVLDGIRHGTGYPKDDFSSSGFVVASVTNALLAQGTSPLAIRFSDGLETCGGTDTNGNCIVRYDLPHPTGMTNVAGYMCWGAHSSLYNEYSRNGTVQWHGTSGWWIIETIESFNGWRGTGQGNFTQWFSDIAFGGTNYENTPIGAVSHTDEPGLSNVNDAGLYFALWASGKNFSICAWNSRRTQNFQAVGDPFITK